MITAKEIDDELNTFRPFRRRWRRIALQWRDDFPGTGRHRNNLRAQVITKAIERVDAGETDPDVITDQVCGSVITTMLITEAVKIIITLIVRFVLKRRGLLSEEIARGLE